MTSKDVKKLYDEGKIDQLYKDYMKYFNIIDKWAETMINGNLLDEFELSQCMEQCNGCQTKVNIVAGALEALVVEYENDYFLTEEKTFTNVRVQDKDHCKAHARKEVGDLKRYASDFTRYSFSAQNTVTVAQSRLKRLSVEKGNKGVDATGDVNQNQQSSDKGW